MSQYREMEATLSSTDYFSSTDFFSSTEYFDRTSDSFTELYLNEFSTLSQNLNITAPKFKAQLLLYDLLIPILGAIIIVLNFAVVISSGLILKKGTQPRSTYLFLGNVAMCDLVTGVSVIFGQLYPKTMRTEFTCAFQLGLIVSSTLTSIYSVGLIAIDRYLFIVHGLKYTRWVYPTRARLCIVFTWLLGCVVGFLPVMGWIGDTLNGKICWFIKVLPPGLIMMTCLIGLLPILVVVALYSIILYHAIKKVLQLRKADRDASNNVADGDNKLRIFRGKAASAPEASEAEDLDGAEKGGIFSRLFKKKPKPKDSKSPSKARAIKVVVFTTGSFIITWVPYFMTAFIYIYCDEKETPEKCKNLRVLIASPLAILGFCNSLINPVIYAWWHKGFREFIKKHVGQRLARKKPGPSSSSTDQTKSSKVSASSSGNRKDSSSSQSDNVKFDTKM